MYISGDLYVNKIELSMDFFPIKIGKGDQDRNFVRLGRTPK